MNTLPPPHSKPASWLTHAMVSHLSFVFVLAVVVFGVSTRWLPPLECAVAAYDVAATIFLLLIWIKGMHGRPEDTKNRASTASPGRNIVSAIVLSCVLMGLASAIVVIGHGPHVHTLTEKVIAIGSALWAVILGWILIHTIFVLHYAHLFYYDDDDNHQADGGMSFPGTKMPDDYDFAYFSFVVGMTFQVSDVQVTRRAMRHTVLLHSVISFVYNTAILALAVNLISSLLR